jgi:hypothetical protein
VSGRIFHNNGVRVGVQNGAPTFDLSGKVYDLKGRAYYRLSGEPTDSRGCDNRLDRCGEDCSPSKDAGIWYAQR